MKYSRHKCLVNEYLLTHPNGGEQFKRNSSQDKSDLDVLLENHRFIWEEEEEDDADDDQNKDGGSSNKRASASSSSLSWGQRLAKKYYERLYREYCICDLTRYKENKVGL